MEVSLVGGQEGMQQRKKQSQTSSRAVNPATAGGKALRQKMAMQVGRESTRRIDGKKTHQRENVGGTVLARSRECVDLD